MEFSSYVDKVYKTIMTLKEVHKGTYMVASFLYSTWTDKT